MIFRKINASEARCMVPKKREGFKLKQTNHPRRLLQKTPICYGDSLSKCLRDPFLPGLVHYMVPRDHSSNIIYNPDSPGFALKIKSVQIKADVSALK